MKLHMRFVDRLPDVSSAGIRTRLEDALLSAGKGVKRAWVDAARAAHAPRSYITGVRGASVAVTRSVEDAQRVEVAVAITSTASGSGWVDAGRSAFHLPTRIRWPSPKTRVDAKGRMYINVPLSKKTADIPAPILRRARKPSRRVTTPGWAGLTRGKASWLLLRRLYADSPGWHIPAQAGKGIAQAVVKDTERAVRARVAEVWK